MSSGFSVFVRVLDVFQKSNYISVLNQFFLGPAIPVLIGFPCESGVPRFALLLDGVFTDLELHRELFDPGMRCSMLRFFFFSD